MTTVRIDDALAAQLMAFAGENEALDEIVARVLTEYIYYLEHIAGPEDRALAEAGMSDYAAGLAREDAAA